MILSSDMLLYKLHRSFENIDSRYSQWYQRDNRYYPLTYLEREVSGETGYLNHDKKHFFLFQENLKRIFSIHGDGYWKCTEHFYHDHPDTSGYRDILSLD